MMTNVPKSALIAAASDCHYYTQEALTGDRKAVLPPGRSQVLLDVISVPGGVPEVLSTVIPPANVAIAIVGVAVEHPNMAAAAILYVAGVTRGNELMGTTTNPYTLRTRVTPSLTVIAGAVATTRTDLVLPGTTILLADGDGINPLWSAVSTVSAPDSFEVYVQYIALDARELSCT